MSKWEIGDHFLFTQKYNNVFLIAQVTNIIKSVENKNQYFYKEIVRKNIHWPHKNFMETSPMDEQAIKINNIELAQLLYE